MPTEICATPPCILSGSKALPTPDTITAPDNNMSAGNVTTSDDSVVEQEGAEETDYGVTNRKGYS